MSGETSRLTITEEIGNFYSRGLLERLLPNLVFTKFGQVRDIPRNAGSLDVKFRGFNALAASTTALSEGTTPSGSALGITDVNATVAQYGDFVGITDVVDFNAIDPVLTEAAQLLGEQAGLTLDVLTRNVLLAGTNVVYANGDATGSVSSNISVAMIRDAVENLASANAKKLTRIISADTGYATSPINASYIGLAHPKTIYTLKGLSGWISVEKYAAQGDIMPGEVGALDEVRFISTSNGSFNDNGGSGSVDVYKTIILGANAYGITRISGEAIRNIVKPLGSSGTADPLDQRATSGWKATFVAKILNENAMVRIEHAVEV
jgi:N4-gp56 family major capsid protein